MARRLLIPSGGSTRGRSSGSARSRRWSSGTRVCPRSPFCSTGPPRPDACWRRRAAENALPSAPDLALAAGGDLERAMEAAQAAGPEFDLTQTLRELLDDGLVVGSSAPRSRMGA